MGKFIRLSEPEIRLRRKRQGDGQERVIACSAAIGIACNRFNSRSLALSCSAVFPRILFLIINIGSKFYSVDRELLQGSWIIFQLIFGTSAALIGICANFAAHKLVRPGLS